MVAGSVPACTRRPRTMRNGDIYAGTACEARVLLDASSTGRGLWEKVAISRPLARGFTTSGLHQAHWCHRCTPEPADAA